MPKYYVKSGQYKFIIDASDHETAILATIKHYQGSGLMPSHKICVSEKGFYDTVIKNGQIDCYNIDDYFKKI